MSDPSKMRVDRLVVFPIVLKQGYMFRCSVLNKTNIMLFAINSKKPDDLIIRFFVDQDLAEAWIDEIVTGKYDD